MISDNTFRKLRLFESQDIVKSRYKALHGRTASAGLTSSITTSITQGRELFETASKSSFATRPILQFYGVSAFSRAMTLFLRPGLSEASLKQSHGLSIVGWNTTSVESLSSLKVKSGEGLFSDVLEATDGAILRANSSAANYKLPYEKVPTDSEFSTEFIFSLIADCWPEYSEWTGKKLERLRITEIKYDEDKKQGSWRMQGHDGMTEEYGKECFAGANVKWPDVMWSSQEAILTSGEWIPQFAQMFEDGFGVVGDIMVVVPMNESDLRLSPLAAYFSAAYVLGMLARYRPSLWMSIWKGTSEDAVSPVFARFMETLERWFPEMVSDILFFEQTNK